MKKLGKSGKRESLRKKSVKRVTKEWRESWEIVGKELEKSEKSAKGQGGRNWTGLHLHV